MADYICKSSLLKRGWTEKIINTLLPEPIKKQNPNYKKAAPMSLWELDKVIELENTPDFIEAKIKKEKRAVGGKKACETKAKNLYNKMSLCNFEIKVIPLEQLRESTLAAKNTWHSESNYYHDTDTEFYVYGADEETIARWEVNYIRHSLTAYDFVCQGLLGKVGKDEAYYALKKNVLERIAKVYPHLSEECKSQIERQSHIPCTETT